MSNRAAFGQWRPKPLGGFPDHTTPLPPNTSAQEICRRFPNHLDDHVILALMRAGKGAKAIDALLPPPQSGKAAQSHSKIQRRIILIREQFPHETFPIPGSRPATRSVPTTTAGPSAAPAGPTGNTTTGTAPGSAGDTTTGTATGPTGNITTGTAAGPSGGNPPANTAAGAPVGSTTAAAGGLAAVQGSMALSAFILQNTIRTAYMQNLQLCANILTRLRPFSTTDPWPSAVAQCHRWYVAESQYFQAMAGRSLTFIVHPDGSAEHPLQYFHRSIRDCFQNEPAVRVAHLPGESVAQAEARLTVASSGHVLQTLHHLNVHLQMRLNMTMPLAIAATGADDGSSSASSSAGPSSAPAAGDGTNAQVFPEVINVPGFGDVPSFPTWHVLAIHQGLDNALINYINFNNYSNQVSFINFNNQ